jgi:hypothetical protein
MKLFYNDASLALLEKRNDESFNRLPKIQFIDKPKYGHFGPVKDYQTLQGCACKTLFIDNTDISSVIYKQFSGGKAYSCYIADYVQSNMLGAKYFGFAYVKVQ